MKRLIENFKEVRSTLVELSENKNVRPSSQAVIKGLAKQASKMKTYISLYVCAEVFSHCDTVARLLQKADISPSGSLSAVLILKSQLQNIRDKLPDLVKEASAQAEELMLEPSCEKRRTKTPARLRDDGASNAATDDCQDFNTKLVASLCCGLDVMLREIEDRFSSSGLALAVRREKVLLKATLENVEPTDLTTLELPQSFNAEKLLVQLNQLQDFLNAGNFTAVSVSELAQMLGQKEKVVQVLFSEVIKLATLCLCQPCSNASSERAFSTLRRLKTWCRNTLGQKRLTHLALMTTNCDILKNLNRVELMKEFVQRTPERRSVFGLI